METTATRKDRVIARLAMFLTRAIYRSVDVHFATPPPPPDRPVLWVANHFGGFSDGLVLVRALPRPPGIVAKDAIWKIPVAGRLMSWIGGIPVHQPDGSGDASANDQMFASCYEALGRGEQLLIFPEGVTRDEPSIARVKTGAARIALGAVADGVAGVRVIPVGVHYENKAALRSRVVVNVGAPIDPVAHDDEHADHHAAPSADDHHAVEALTNRIDRELRRAAPDYEDWGEASSLTTAAEVTLRSVSSRPGPVPVELRDRMANVLADRPAEDRAAIREATESYDADLEGVGLTDAALAHQLGSGRFTVLLGIQLLLVVVLLPFALIGAAINLVPFLIVKAVGLLRVAPAVLASVKPLVAILAFGLTWGLVLRGAFVEWGFTGLAAGVLLIPCYSVAVLLVADRLVLLGGLLRRWRAHRRPAGVKELLADERSAVVDAVLSTGPARRDG